MSKKSFLNRFKTVKTNTRTMEEINKEYAELISKVGQSQYLVYIYERETAELNKRLKEVNEEASRRQQLDRDENLKKNSVTPPEVAQTETVTNEQA